MDPSLQGFHDWLMKYPDRKWGFITYRCTYDDDEAWSEFMDFLKARVKLTVEGEGAGDIYDRIDWIVIEDATLDGADQKEVKKQFKKFIKDTDRIDIVMSREHACIMVNEEAMNSTKGRRVPKADKFDDMGFSWVWLVSSREREKPVRVGMSYLMPRAYDLIEVIDWNHIYSKSSVFTS